MHIGAAEVGVGVAEDGVGALEQDCSAARLSAGCLPLPIITLLIILTTVRDLIIIQARYTPDRPQVMRLPTACSGSSLTIPGAEHISAMTACVTRVHERVLERKILAHREGL